MTSDAHKYGDGEHHYINLDIILYVHVRDTRVNDDVSLLSKSKLFLCNGLKLCSGNKCEPRALLPLHLPHESSSTPIHITSYKH